MSLAFVFRHLISVDFGFLAFSITWKDLHSLPQTLRSLSFEFYGCNDCLVVPLEGEHPLEPDDCPPMLCLPHDRQCALVDLSRMFPDLTSLRLENTSRPEPWLDGFSALFLSSLPLGLESLVLSGSFARHFELEYAGTGSYLPLRSPTLQRLILNSGFDRFPPLDLPSLPSLTELESPLITSEMAVKLPLGLKTLRTERLFDAKGPPPENLVLPKTLTSLHWKQTSELMPRKWHLTFPKHIVECSIPDCNDDELVLPAHFRSLSICRDKSDFRAAPRTLKSLTWLSAISEEAPNWIDLPRGLETFEYSQQFPATSNTFTGFPQTLTSLSIEISEEYLLNSLCRALAPLKSLTRLAVRSSESRPWHRPQNWLVEESLPISLHHLALLDMVTPEELILPLYPHLVTLQAVVDVSQFDSAPDLQQQYLASLPSLLRAGFRGCVCSRERAIAPR